MRRFWIGFERLRRRGTSQGYTFVELLIVTVILLILASVVLPLAQVTTQRQREAELRRALREMRTAIDNFKDAVDTGQIPMTEVEPGSNGYPPNLETLVDGVTQAGDASGQPLRFLRRIPVDPMTGEAEWGLRAYSDPPNAAFWSGGSVYDIYSLSRGTAINGTEYREW